MELHSQLDIAPRTRGRGAKALTFGAVVELQPGDLVALNAERGTKPPSIVEIRDRHHALARCLASGMKPSEASLHTGYSPSRISILQSDPTFQSLVSDYRTMRDAAEASFSDRTKMLSVSTVAALQDTVDAHLDGVEVLSPSILLEVAKFAADRTGNGPTTKTTNVNVNVGLGNRMTEARERARQLRIVSSSPITESGGSDGPDS